MTGSSDSSGIDARLGARPAPDDVVFLTGTSPAVRALEQEVERAGRCDSKVLITGESGAGKEVVARLIHKSSLRRRAPMLAVNCGGIPDSLLESTLFGHARGSFTGAYRDNRGLFEAAHPGTLFLDEISETSPRMQVLLLRFLESGETQRVGADRPPSRVDVRVMAATNKDLRQAVAAGEFREDLFFRLNVLQVAVPALRDRPEDIPPLLDHFLSAYSAERGIAVPALGPGVQDRLVSYLWPGNIRELRNVVECAVLRIDDGVIRLEHLPRQFQETAESQAIRSPSSCPPASVAKKLYDQMVLGGESFWTVVYEPFMARDLTRQDVREIVRLGLQKTLGSYRVLVETFHMRQDDYRRFLNFLRTFNCHVPFHSFRVVPARAGLGKDDSPHDVESTASVSTPFHSRSN